MKSSKTLCSFSFAALTLAGSLSALAQAAPGSNDAQIQVEVQKTLDKKEFRDVHATVTNGDVTLSGTVDRYAQKEDADRKVHHAKRVHAVTNMITVGGPSVDDLTLRNKLAEALAYDRVGYGTTAFNSITLGVQNGVVTLGGSAYGPADRSSAVGVASNFAGVKDVIDNIQVDPVSPIDDGIRLATARAVYGSPQLSKYAIDPARPIRITVVNGNVTLTGVVDTKADSDVAAIKANTVAGVFKVTNQLQIAGSQPGK